MINFTSLKAVRSVRSALPHDEEVTHSGFAT